MFPAQLRACLDWRVLFASVCFLLSVSRSLFDVSLPLGKHVHEQPIPRRPGVSSHPRTLTWNVSGMEGARYCVIFANGMQSGGRACSREVQYYCVMNDKERWHSKCASRVAKLCRSSLAHPTAWWHSRKGVCFLIHNSRSYITIARSLLFRYAIGASG